LIDSAANAADLLAGLSARGETIEHLPDALRPRGADDAVAIQRAFLARHASPGWKVGPRPDGTGWCAAPLRGAGAMQSPAELSAASAATMRIEVEVAIVLGRDLPAGSTPAEAKAAIGGAHLALELFRSSFADPARQDFASLLADNLSNAGVVLGGGQPSADLDLASLNITLRRDAEDLASVDTGAPLETLLDAMSWLATYASSLGAPLRRGAVIITGARIGPVSVRQPGYYAASSALGDVAMQVAG
jgi:2-keto-4-pentenoate hydratase